MLHLEIEPTYTSSTQNFRSKFRLEFYIYNPDLKHYEPLVEEISGSVSYTHDYMRLNSSGPPEDDQTNPVKSEMFHSSVFDISIQALNLNLKPSLFTNVVDTLSLFSSNNLKLRAEKNSILRVENLTGLEISCSVLNTQKSTRIHGYEEKEINMIVLPKNDSIAMNLLPGGSGNPEDPSLTIADLKDYMKTNLRSLKIKDLQSDLPQSDPEETV